MGEQSPFNALSQVTNEISQHKVKLVLSGCVPLEYFLIIMKVKISLLEEFLLAYGSSLKKMAERVIDGEARWYEYGVVFNDRFEMVFAFNLKFAGVNSSNHTIEYKDSQDVLADLITIQPQVFEDPFNDLDEPESPGGPVMKYGVIDPGGGGFKPPNLRPPWRPGGWNMVVRYALPDPSNEDAPAPNQGQ